LAWDHPPDLPQGRNPLLIEEIAMRKVTGIQIKMGV
jgi:hypothetical protein